MNSLKGRVVILSISALINSHPAASPAIADMIEAYPTINASTVMWVVSLPAITIVLFSLIYGSLVRFVPKRSLMIAAMALFILGGIGPALTDNFFMILALRGLLGAGIGFLKPLGTGLIAQLYEGEDRAAMMGWQSAAVNLGSLTFMLFAGLLAAIHWNYTFYTYAIGLVIAFLLITSLPEPEQPAQAVSAQKTMPRGIFFLTCSVLFYNLLFYSFMTNYSVMIRVEELGDTAQAGMGLTMFMVGGSLAGITYGRIALLTRSYTNAAGWLITGAGMLVTATSQVSGQAALGAFVAGSGMAITMPSYLIRVSIIVPPAAVAVAYAYLFGFLGIGQFVSPLFFDVLVDLLQQDIGRFPILASAVILLCGGLFAVMAVYRERLRLAGAKS